MSVEIVIRGENRLLKRQLRLVDGTPLPRSALSLLKVSLMQKRVAVHEYILGTHNHLRAGATDDEVVLELTSALSLSLDLGNIGLRWEMRIADAGFVVEPGLFIDLVDETPWKLIA